MRELLDTLALWRADGVAVGRAVVIRTFGSAPRPEGAVMLAASDGRLAGSVSGGCVEGAAFGEIEQSRTTGRSRVIRYGISDEQAWDVGLACGGTIDVLVEPAVRPEVEAAARSTDGRAVVIPLPPDAPGPAFGPHPPGPGGAPGAAMEIGEDGSVTGSTGDVARDRELQGSALDALRRGASRTIEVGGAAFFIEAYPQRLRLVIVGAVQAAIPLVSMARTLGYETVVVDGRPTFATPERFPDVDRLVVAWPDEAAALIGLGPSDAVAILSHDPKFDEPAIVAALGHGCRYVGAIGSRKTQGDRLERLRAAGLSEPQLARLHGPIGLDLGGASPAEVALAVLAEVVADRHGASARPMRERAGARAGARAVDVTGPAGIA